MHKSIATIDSPEFINLQPLDINPLMSSCEIKVFYLGENRNHSYITKDVAEEMAKSLRGAPIVGYYRDDKQDFADHGEKIVFDDEGVKFECMTKPYGFVAPDAKVWFQKFEDTDDFGNIVTREYMMTTGYLWTGQYEEAKMAIDSGKPQSMELDSETLDGQWSTDVKTNMDFFIINDAIFSKLCILGDDVEPCFEGASVTAPQVSTSYSLDDTFKHTLYTMMQELKTALEGGQSMEEKETEVVVEEKEEVVETPVVEEETTEEAPAIEEEVVETEEEIVEEEKVEEIIEENDNLEQSISTENQNSIEAQSNQENYAKAEEDKKEDEEESDEKDSESESEEESEKADDEDKEEDKKKYSLLEENYTALETKYAELEAKYQELVAFKAQVEDEKKDELISSFYMLSDEDKADVIANKANYSLEDIEAKLSVICVRKKVSFDIEKEEKSSNEKAAVTYTVDNEVGNVPAYISALRNTQNKNKNN